MEINIVSRIGKEDDPIELPPGFRFHPTDEELITHYLSPKVLDSSFSACAMGEVDLNKCEPWDLPRRAKMGEKEWYFFCVRDRKYPTGLRTNRATEAGYWKATGKDKEIYRAKTLIGMKKTLVFYKGRAPRGEKTNWIMHEYRLERNIPEYNPIKTTKNEWVICRIFQKCSGGKKTHVSGLVRLGSHGNQLLSCLLPPLTDSPPHESETKTTVGESSHVTCFSDPLEDQKTKDDMVDSFDNNGYLASSSTSNGSFTFPRTTPTEPYPSTQVATSVAISQLSDSFLMQDQSILRMLLNTKAELSWQGDLSSNDMSSTVANQEMVHKSFGDQLEYLPSTPAGPVDFGCLWNY